MRAQVQGSLVVRVSRVKQQALTGRETWTEKRKREAHRVRGGGGGPVRCRGAGKGSGALRKEKTVSQSVLEA